MFKYEKLSCRREIARRFASLNSLPSHLWSLKAIRNDTLEYRRVYVPISIPLKVSMYVVPFMRYSASKNVVTLKSGVGVVQGY